VWLNLIGHSSACLPLAPEVGYASRRFLFVAGTQPVWMVPSNRNEFGGLAQVGSVVTVWPRGASELLPRPGWHNTNPQKR
jgi:hypothetical protein